MNTLYIFKCCPGAFSLLILVGGSLGVFATLALLAGVAYWRLVDTCAVDVEGLLMRSIYVYCLNF